MKNKLASLISVFTILNFLRMIENREKKCLKITLQPRPYLPMVDVGILLPTSQHDKHCVWENQ